MIENGAALNVKNSWEETPLHMAVNYERLDTVEYILEQDKTFSAITEVDNGFNTPLHLAASIGNCGMVKLLLSRFTDTLEKSVILEKRLDDN